MTLYFELINQFRETALYFGMKKALEGQTIAHRQVDSTNNSYILLDEPKNCTKNWYQRTCSRS